MPEATYAIISDLHANLEALLAVLADIDALGIQEIRCLGDVVGYGPSPNQVTDLVRARCVWTLKGNHDEALVHGAYRFNLRAKLAIDWTRDQLEPGFSTDPAAFKRWSFLTGLPLRHEEGSDLFVHGSPRDPTSEYLLASELQAGLHEKFSEVFAAFGRRLFVGHSHLPCVITDSRTVLSLEELNGCFSLPGEGLKAIINVGSVGQPRDGDPRACYVVVDGGTVHWRRVEYDIEQTIARIAQIRELDVSLGERLREGR